MRRRLAIALSVSIVILAIAPGAGLARGPQKNDSVSGHGIVVDDTTTTPTTYEFRVSAHTVSDTTTLATGNMFLRLTTTQEEFGTVSISIWADVYCVSTLAINGEVRGHVYRSSSNLFDGQDLIFNVTDLSGVSDAPDLFFPNVEPQGTNTCTEPPEPGVLEVAKGNITVDDE